MEYNYTQLLAFDCCTSVSYTKSQGSRKLIAWKDRISATDKPASLQVDFLDNNIADIGTTTSLVTVTFQSLSNNVASYTGTNLQVNIHVVNKTMSVIFTHPLGGVQYEVINSAQIEGFYTLQDLGNGSGNGGSDPIRVNVVDPQVRNGDDIVRIRYEEIHRGAVTDELDHYCYSRLNTITNESIKGHELQGTWRLTDIIKQDSDDPDLIRLTLEYKRGYATTLDFSEAVLVNKEDYRTDTTKIIIQFNNIDPRYVETAKDVYRSQETLSNPVFGGVVYDGFWHNIRMVTSETAMSDRGADMSSAVSVTWLLTQHNNTDVYFKFLQSSSVTKGFFYKWDATETTLNSLIANTHFKANGDQDTDDPPAASSKTLQEDMPGRTVVMRRTSRDEGDRLYDLEIELTFFTGIAVTSNNFGTYSIENTVTVKENQSSLPTQNDLNFAFETDGTQLTSKRLAGPTGTGNPIINDSEQFNFSIVSEKIKVTETAGINNVTDGTDFHVVGMGKRATRNNVVKNTSFQQIRRRIGGELEFPRDSVTGELEGVDWDESWNSNSNANGGTYPNATAPDNWISAGYQERYGNWQPYWVEALVVGENSLVQPDNETAQFKGLYQNGGFTTVNRGDIFITVANPGANNESSTFIKVNVLKSNVYFSTNPNVDAYRLAGNKFYTRIASDVYVTENNTSVSCNLFGPEYNKYGAACWAEGVSMFGVETDPNNHSGQNTASKSDIRSKIGRAGTGLGAQFPTTHLFDIDYYIAIKEPLTRELDWDDTWEWNSTTTYANNHIIFYNQNEKLYKAKNSPSAGTLPTDASKWDEVTDSPTTWTNNYASVYGSWMTRWTKGFLTGEGSLIEAFHGGVPRNRGIGHSTQDVYHLYDVILTQSTAADRRQNPLFKSFSGSNIANYNGTINYTDGAKVKYEGQVYTANGAIYQNTTGAPVGFIDNGPKIPGTPNGSQWTKGVTTAANDFDAINTNNVRAKIALKGSGIVPFEVPEQVKVLSSSGNNAISKTAKMAFYTNPNENPRMSEIIECVKRDEMEITLRTYFALNPDYLLPANRRIPVDVNDLDALRDWVLGKLTFSSTNSATRLRVPQEFVINNEKSNYELSFVRGRDRDIFYIDAIIILRTEFVKDTSAMEAIKQRLTNTANAKITDDKIVIQRDLTPTTKPWSGDFLDK